MSIDGKPLRHLSAIDGVRFCCALLVVAYHYATVLPMLPPDFAAGAVARDGLARGGVAWTWFGWIGVEIFFVVSGYVIAASSEAVDAATFVRRRLLRLAPAAWICATITAIVLLFGGAAGDASLLIRWAGSVTLFPGAPQIDASYWTLGIEVMFYGLVAAWLGRGANTVAVERIGLFLACLTLAYWPAAGGGTWNAEAGLLRLVLVPHGCFFGLGIALSSVHRRGPSPVAVATLAAGLVAATVEIAGEALAFGRHGIGNGPAIPLALFHAAVLAIAASGPLQAPLARRVGAERLALLGLMTYPLYLVHQFAGETVIIALRARGVPSAVAIVPTMALAVVTAWAIARFAEPQLRGWLARRLTPRHGRGADSLPTASLPAG